MSVQFPKGTEKALAQRMMARTKALRSLLVKRLETALTRPNVSAAEVAEVLAQTRRTYGLMPPPKVSELMGTALGVQDGVARGVVEAVSKASGRDLSRDLRLQTWELQREAQRVEWAQTVLAQQQRIERELFDRLERKARAALDAGQPRQVLDLAAEQVEQADGRLRLLARHEVGNLVGTVTAQTSQALGVRRYTWRSERDERVRPLHKKLDGTIRSWDDPHPTEGHPGATWGCRCTAQPVVDEAAVREATTPPRSPARPAPLPAPAPVPRARPAGSPQPQTAPRQTPPAPPRVAPQAPVPIQIPVLPPLPQLPPKPALPPVPTFAPQPLPAFPGSGSVAPVSAPVLAPKAPVPVLPELQIPTFPPPRPRPSTGTVDELLARNYRAFRTERDVRAYGAELAAARQPLSRPEKIAVAEYSGSEYIPINAALRSGRRHATAKDLDKAIERGVLPEDIQVHRGIRAHPALANMDLVSVGDVITDAAYQSTTLDRMASFPGSIKLHINVPRGSKALWIDDISSNPGEYELLLPRNARFQIVKKEYIGNAWHLDVLLLPEP